MFLKCYLVIAIIGARTHIMGRSKNINGELAYRNRCRKLYGKLSKNQIQEIEYEFAYRLYNLYKENHMKKESAKYLNYLLKTHPMITVSKEAKRFISGIKWKLNNKKCFSCPV